MIVYVHGCGCVSLNIIRMSRGDDGVSNMRSVYKSSRGIIIKFSNKVFAFRRIEMRSKQLVQKTKNRVFLKRVDVFNILYKHFCGSFKLHICMLVLC